MTFLQNYIKNHPLTWKKDIINLKIQIKEENNLILFKYDIDADFNNPIVKECRGIILDSNSFNIVCRGFDKFFNYQESYVDEIDWSSARVQEKIDGSIIKLYFWNGEWRWATNNTIFAETCRISSSSKSFYDLITSAVNYTAIDYTKLNTQYTYIFELVSPENRIVIEYPSTKLYHLGTRDNVTGEEYDIDIGVEKTKTYPITTFDECLEAVTKLNVSLDDIAHEGFVVVDKNYHRIKVKTSEYFDIHHKINNHILTQKRCLEYILNEPETVATLKATFPEYSHMF
ncbi:MAG TPA: T4 RnlA family RNA ligase, partial [Bacteroidales bacterium]|nr:T4 RnlA family RNA ligase [Bacteroidales bacterium]